MVDGLNNSDHSAISLKYILVGGFGMSALSVIKMRWDCANLQLYQSECTQLLASLDLPIDAFLCTERDCVKHNCDSDCYYRDIVHCLNTASVPAVPRVKTGVEKHWWSQKLDELKSQCMQITDQWRSAGCPSSGEINSLRLKCKLRYKAAIKQAIQQADEEFNDELADYLCQKKFDSFW